MSNLALALAVALLYWWSARREPRRLRLGVYLVAILWLVFLAAMNLVAASLPQDGLWPLVILVPLPLSVLVLAGFLVANGLTMVRKEGRSLSNLLSLLLGLTLVALPVGGLLLARSHVGVLLGTAALAFFVSFYLGLAFLSFLAYAVSYSRTTARADPAAVVVLGAGLVRGRITRLLQSRLDKGVDEWQRQVALGYRPLLVPSGGQGHDEPLSEGAAMADYLMEHGIPAADVAPETAARTTEENLGLSQRVALDRGREGHLTVVTSGYHVARTSLLTRRAGLDAEVIGSHTARYFVPSAFLREFVAVLTYHPRLHVVLLLPAVALSLLLARAV
ncbi:MAG: YdcF family protein [Terracoccus sp.]